ncbi:MAG: hypothetical protein ACYCYO_18745 [Bacilli bacterium]
MDILENMYSRNMLVPEQVLAELAKIPHLISKVESSISKQHISKVALDPLKPEAVEYVRLLEGVTSIGRGEAAVMAYVKFNGGTISSNNLKDVLEYSESNGLPLLSIRAMFYDAVVHDKILTEPQAEQVWGKMLDKHRYLPCSTVKEVIAFYSVGLGQSMSLHRY